MVMGKRKIVVYCYSGAGSDLVRTLEKDGYEIVFSEHAPIYSNERVPGIMKQASVSQPACNKFIQQKMQGKRRVY